TRHSSFHAPSLNIIHPSLPSFPTRRSSDLDGDELREGLVLIAPGDYHMVITPAKRVRLNQDPPVHYVRPSVDVMMLSVAAVFGPRVVGVVLTGMGRDGSGGMAAIKKAGGRTIVQDEETSV